MRTKSGTLPAELTEQQVKDDQLWMRSEQRAAPGTLCIAIGGLRCVNRQTHPVTREVLDRFRTPKGEKLPSVLSVWEVRHIFHAIRRPRGLRLRGKRRLGVLVVSRTDSAVGHHER